MKFVIDGTAKVIAFLLINLGLWLPAIYSIIYLIVCAAARVKLVGGIISIFYIGLVVSFVIGLLLSYWVYKLKIRKKNPNRNDAKVISQKTEKARKGDSQDFSDEDEGPAEIKTHYRKSYYEERDYGDLNQKYFGNGEPIKKNRTVDDDEFAIDEEDYDDREKKASRRNADKNFSNSLDMEEVKNSKNKNDKNLTKRGGYDKREQSAAEIETPMVFAMRNDPNMLVHEYNDRFEFFKKIKTGYEYIKTEYKNSKY